MDKDISSVWSEIGKIDDSIDKFACFLADTDTGRDELFLKAAKYVLVSNTSIAMSYLLFANHTKDYDLAIVANDIYSEGNQLLRVYFGKEIKYPKE